MLRALHPEPGMIRGRLCAGLFSVIPGVVLSQLLTPCSNILIWFLRTDGKVYHPPSLEPRRQTIEEVKELLGFAWIESVFIYLVVEGPGWCHRQTTQVLDWLLPVCSSADKESVISSGLCEWNHFAALAPNKQSTHIIWIYSSTFPGNHVFVNNGLGSELAWLRSPGNEVIIQHLHLPFEAVVKYWMLAEMFSLHYLIYPLQ